MFLEPLTYALRNPQGRLFRLDDDLPLDTDCYRALLTNETWRKAQCGEIDQATAVWVFQCIADGWVDEHLSDIRDAVIEMFAVRNADHLHALLCRATTNILGSDSTPRDWIEQDVPLLSLADVELLKTASRTVSGETVPRLGARLFARRYATQLGLLVRQSGFWQRTCLGDAALELPRAYVWPFLLSLETLQTMGAEDKWHVSKEALATMQTAGCFEVCTSFQDSETAPPAFSWLRTRRLQRQGLVQTVVEGPSDTGHATCLFRLTAIAIEACARLVRVPEHEVMRLARTLLWQQTEEQMEPYRLVEFTDEALDTDVCAKHTLHHEFEPLRVGSPFSEKGPSAPLGDSQRSQTLHRATDLNLATEPFPFGQDSPTSESSDGGVFAESPEDASPSERPGLKHRMPGEIDLGKLIRAAWDDLQDKRVHFTLLGPQIHVAADRRALLRTLREVLRASATSARHSTHSLSLVSVSMATQADQVVLLVHDNGMGTPLPPRPPIFKEVGNNLAEVVETDPGRPSFQRIQSHVSALGGELSLLPPRLGGTSMRIALPRATQPPPIVAHAGQA
ncbi:MAG TPA: hypothetical protein PKE31_08200 [Pseudomonadota bacterium]|nr:hypothetical protein [Pseudomonadota bacterium]